MDWKDIARVVAPLAPTAGSILGGLIPFPGGSFIGQKFGEIIAAQFGVQPTPQAVSEAIASATEETARAKINAAVEQARIQVQGFVDIERAYLHLAEVGLTQTGQTMRAELEHQHWYFTGWRPACGWVFVANAIAFGVMLLLAACRAQLGDPAPLKILTEAWPIFAAYFGTLAAMVGVYVTCRSQEKKAATEFAPAPAQPAKPAPTKRG